MTDITGTGEANNHELYVPRQGVGYIQTILIDGEYRTEPNRVLSDFRRICNLDPETGTVGEDYQGGDWFYGQILQTEITKAVENTVDSARKVFNHFGVNVRMDDMQDTKGHIKKSTERVLMANAAFLYKCFEYARIIRNKSTQRSLKEAEGSYLFNSDYRDDINRYKTINPAIFDALSSHARGHAGLISGMICGMHQGCLNCAEVNLQGPFFRLFGDQFDRLGYLHHKKLEIVLDNPDNDYSESHPV